MSTFRPVYAPLIPPQSELVFKKIVHNKNITWYVPQQTISNLQVINAGDHIWFDSGGGGCCDSIIQFKLVDGTIEKVKGPWKSNSEALFNDTDIDLRHLHLTFGVISENYSWELNEFSNLLYRDPTWIVGPINRIRYLAEQIEKAKYYYFATVDGSRQGKIREN